MTAPHAFTADEENEGDAQARALLERLAAGGAEVDALGQGFEIARMSSMARARGFARRIQLALQGGGGDA